MSDIVLTTFNAKYIHPALGLRCLQANLGPLRERSRILEFDLRFPAANAADRILSAKPRIVGIGVHIWNLHATRHLVAALRKAAPSTRIVLGGPEASFAPDDEPAVRSADFVIAGEAELAFRDLCVAILRGEPPTWKRLDAPPPDLATLALPYDLYTDDDVAHRFMYVEATRGCPFRCEYCLSSRETGVRRFPLPAFTAALDRLLERGALRFKFLDRSFNANGAISAQVLDHFLARVRPGLMLHFELVPDRLPQALLDRFRLFPPGVLRFEVGVQSFNSAVNRRIRRIQDNRGAVSNLQRLRRETGALIHADLIVGLPGENMASFGRGFDRLLRLDPHEVQVGVLKNLRGTTIARHAARWGMSFSPDPPYEVLETKTIPRAQMERLHRFARYFGMFHNHGHFGRSLPRLWTLGRSRFTIFLAFSDWLHARFGRSHAIPLSDLASALFHYLCESGDNPAEAEAAIRADYEHKARREKLRLTRPAMD